LNKPIGKKHKICCGKTIEKKATSGKEGEGVRAIQRGRESAIMPTGRTQLWKFAGREESVDLQRRRGGRAAGGLIRKKYQKSRPFP